MRPISVLVSLVLAAAAVAAEPDKDGFVPLFNGKDLTGWHFVNTPSKTFYVKDGEIITTGQPIGYMRTDKQYENFVLEMEWMHVNKTEVGNSGLFVWGDAVPVTGSPFTRGIEVQVLVNLEYKDKKGRVTATSHGDVFAIQGATCKPDRPHPNGSMRCLPSEYRAKGGGEWNHYRVEAKDGVIKLSVNGKEVSGVSECKPRKGYLALESEGAECHFRNIRIKELPSSNPKPEEVGTVAEGHKLLFNGLDLDGWKGDPASWRAGGGVLRSLKDGSVLLTEGEFAGTELVFDWRPTGKRDPGTVAHPQVGLRRSGKEPGIVMVSTSTDNRVSVHGGTKNARIVENAIKDFRPDRWHRVRITLTGNHVSVEQDGQPVVKDWVAGTVNRTGAIGLSGFGGVEFMNVFVRELK